LYGCEAWSLRGREEHTYRVFEKRVLRTIFRLKGEEVARDWRRLHNEELHNLYASPYIIMVIKSRRMRWKGHVARMGDITNAYNIVIGILKGRDHLDNITVDGRIILERILGKRGGGGGVMDWMQLAQYRDQWWALVDTVINLRVL
jgi:hypothetical protein